MKPVLMIISAIGGLGTCQVDMVSLELQNLRGAIAVYKIRTERWPRTLDELVDAGMLDRSPNDPWGRPYLWIRPVDDRKHGCLMSAGEDGALGTRDDRTAGCELELLNQHLLVEAGLAREGKRSDAYGNPIYIVRRRGGLLAWSFGPDGKPDTDDDQMARIARKGR